MAKTGGFYQNFYQVFFVILIVMIFALIGMVGFVLYQVFHRPLPLFSVGAPNGKVMSLTPYDEPNMLPNTLLTWASKAAVAAYTFDFVNYNKEIELAHPYFTDNGWQDYQSSVANLISDITQKRDVLHFVLPHEVRSH